MKNDRDNYFVFLDKVTKKFGKVVAVNKVVLGIEKGGFLVILGPSGCGKTTTLRIIAGLEIPDEGHVYIDGVDVTYREPSERDIAMVFQDYALYPHMTVFENIAFPLMMRRKKLGLTKKDISARVYHVAKLLQIDNLLDRKPTQLSGGQQQRVALARALVREPKVWLMDEPLSNLDALVRLQVRAELKKLQKDLGITTIYVTHDQSEALTLADKIAVMRHGKVLQIDTPRNIYELPKHLFVATFVGIPPMNVIECRIQGEVLECPGFHRKIDKNIKLPSRVCLGIRPEHISISTKPLPNSIKAKVYVVEPLGSEYIVNVSLDDKIIKIKLIKEFGLSPGDNVYLRFDWSKVLVFDPASEELIDKFIKVVKELEE